VSSGIRAIIVRAGDRAETARARTDSPWKKPMNLRSVRPLAVLGTLAAALASLPLLARAQAPAAAQDAVQGATPAVVSLDAFDLEAFDQDWGHAQPGKSVEGHPLSIGGEHFEHGVGTHANSECTIALGGAALAFTAEVGVDDEPCGGAGTVVFVVLVDGKERLRTATLKKGDAPHHVEVALTDARELTLLVEDAGDGINYDHADWADAKLRLSPGARTLPHTTRADDTPMEVANGDDPAPRLNHPRITGGTPGKPFLFRIPASGSAPLTFAAEGLPHGIALDPQSGVLSGELEDGGRFDVKVTVSNALGKTTRTVTIVAADHALALTPPLGWNSWNCWALDVDDAKVRAAADAFVEKGLAAHGYTYVNIDDGWEKGRDPQGRIVTNERFPDMKALAAYVHSKGLKLGIYSSPGPKTCGGFEGSWQHEAQDAQSYAEWGIDYLKYDWCSYGNLAPKPDRAALQKPYALMEKHLRASPRDIVFSLCQYGMGEVWKWGAEVDGNCWRTTGDINDSWSSMAGIGFAQIGIAPHAVPGHWNDPDMLVVGKVGWSAHLHPTRLTHNEQITHITLWSMLRAPLLLGCDLDALDDFTLALITNDDVLAINQDELGAPAVAVRQEAGTDVWSRPLADGTLAVALFNRARAAATVAVTWKELGLPGPQPVRDCWRRRDVESDADGLSVKLPRHAAALFRVGAARE
jgi:alpha-galactosidase